MLTFFSQAFYPPLSLTVHESGKGVQQSVGVWCVMKCRGLFVASALSLAVFLHAPVSVAAAPAGKDAGDNGVALLLVEAIDALQEGQAAMAERLLTRAIDSGRLEPEALANALVNRALARQKLGRDKEAIRDYSAALKIDALSGHARAVALYNRGLAHRRLGMPARAAEDFTSAIYLDPRFAAAYFSRGNVLFRAGQNLFALADYEKALKYGYEKPHLVHYALALVNLALDRREEAREQLRMALEQKPDYAPARRQLASLMRADGIRLAELPPKGTGPAAKDTPASRKLAAMAERNRTNLRRKARPLPVPPGEVETPVRRDERKPAADGLLVASVDAARPAKTAKAARKPRRKQAPAIAEKRPAIARIAAAAKAGAGTGAGAMTGTLSPTDVQVMPVSAPAKEQNIHAAAPSAKAMRNDAVKTASLGPVSADAAARAARAAADAARADDSVAAPAEPVISGWAIQLASQPSEKAAWAHWKKLERKVKRVVRNAKVAVMKAEIPGKGTFYRVRLVGFEERKSPRRLCSRLKRRGVSCYVTRAGS